MTSLVSFPVELVTKIVSHVVHRRDLATLRLTSRILKEIATPFYFNTVPMYPVWNEDDAPDPPFPNHIDYDTRYMSNILNNEHLKKLVKKIQIYTCNPDCDHHPHWVHHAGNWGLYSGFMPQPTMSDDWEEVYKRIPEFPKLNTVSLVFDRHAADEDRDYGEEELQGPRDRIAAVRQLLCLLGKRIEDLSIRHMQLNSWSVRRNEFSRDPELPADLELKNVVLAGLKALRMNVVHLQPHGESGPVYKVTNCHREWAEFPSFWLAPAVNLRHLTLYSDVPVGWFPKLDLRSVHFAQLETLALGQFVFANDVPFEWITKHSDTLKELYLDHCSILYQRGASIRQREWLDEEGYPITEPEPSYSILEYYTRDKTLCLESYAKRWHEVFAHFSNTLGQLHTFRFGSSAQWKFDVVNRYDDGSPGMPIMPWDAERDLQNDIFPERYLVWDDFQDDYVTEWKLSTDKEVRDPKTWDEEDYKRFDSYPDCTNEDQSALQEFAKKLGMPNVDKIGVSELKPKYQYWD